MSFGLFRDNGNEPGVRADGQKIGAKVQFWARPLT
jgi:hypothetical protein